MSNSISRFIFPTSSVDKFAYIFQQHQIINLPFDSNILQIINSSIAEVISCCSNNQMSCML